MGVSPSTLTAGIEDELIETSMSHGLERERAFQVDLSRLIVGQHWRSKDNLISAAEARSSVPSESDFLGGEELLFPGGEQSEELVPMCKAFVKFLWARKKPHMPACMCVMLGLLTTVHAVLSGRIVDEITAIANTGDSIWLVTIFVVAMMVNSTVRSVLFCYEASRARCARSICPTGAAARPRKELGAAAALRCGSVATGEVQTHTRRLRS